MKFKDRPQGLGFGKDLIKLKSGESVKGVFRGEITDFAVHWKNKRSLLCAGDGCKHCADPDMEPAKWRFMVNFVMQENGAMVAKIFEQSGATYDTLKGLAKEYPITQTQMKVSRYGSGPNDTTYALLPLPRWQVEKALEKKLSEVKLHDLEKIIKAKGGAVIPATDATDSAAADEEESAFG